MSALSSSAPRHRINGRGALSTDYEFVDRPTELPCCEALLRAVREIRQRLAAVIQALSHCVSALRLFCAHFFRCLSCEARNAYRY